MVAGIRGARAPASLKPRHWNQWIKRWGRGIRGARAPASLKQFTMDSHEFFMDGHPGRARPGLIEALYSRYKELNP